jgi:succinyl-diaminopimelate desuccinylase
MIAVDDSVYNETIANLQKLVSTCSVNPPGNENQIVEIVRKLLAENDIQSTVVPLSEGRSSLVARIPGQESGSMVLCGHLDTVNAEKDDWTVPIFEPRIENGRMWGLGSADMKSGVATIIEMALIIKRSGLCPKKDLVLALTADEEYAYRGAASVVKSGLIDDAQLLLITEPPAGKIYCGQKGELWIEATFTGKAAHGSMPSQGINTIIPASRFCLKLAEDAGKFSEVPGRGTTSLNIGQINGGCQVNIVPATTKVRLDSRVVSDDDKNMMVNLVTEHGKASAKEVKAGFSSTILSYKPPIVSDPQNPYIREFLSAAEKCGTKPKVEIAPYSTDAVEIVPRLGVPVVIFGPGNIAQAHQPDEFLELSSLKDALEVIAMFINQTLLT